MATDVDYTLGTAGAFASDAPFFFRKQAVLDAATTNIANAATCQCIDVKAKEFVLFVALEVLTLEGATQTVDVGDDDNDDGYLAAVNCNDVAGDVYVSNQTLTMSTTNANMVAGDTDTLLRLVGGKLYDVADTVDVLFNNAADACKLRLTVMGMNVHGTQTKGNAVVT